MQPVIEQAAAETIVGATPHAKEAGVTAGMLVERVHTATSYQEALTQLQDKELTSAAIGAGIADIENAGAKTAAAAALKIVQRHVEGGAVAADLPAIRMQVYEALKDDPHYQTKLAAGIGDPGVLAFINELALNNPSFELLVRQEADDALAMRSPEAIRTELTTKQMEAAEATVAFDKADRDLKAAELELSRIQAEVANYYPPAAGAKNKYTEMQALSTTRAQSTALVAAYQSRIALQESNLEAYRTELKYVGLRTGTRAAGEVNVDIDQALSKIGSFQKELATEQAKILQEQQLRDEREDLQRRESTQSEVIGNAELAKQQAEIKKTNANARVVELQGQLENHDTSKKDACEAIYARAAKQYSQQQVRAMTKVAYEQIGRWEQTLPEQHARALSKELKTKLFEQETVKHRFSRVRRHKQHTETRVNQANLNAMITQVDAGGAAEVVRETLLTKTNPITKGSYTDDEITQLLMSENGPNLRKMAIRALMGTGELSDTALSPEKKSTLIATPEGQALLAEGVQNEELMAKVNEEAERGGFKNAPDKEKIRRALDLNPLLMILLLGGVLVSTAAGQAGQPGQV